MAMPTVTMRDLLEAGVHFGHQTYRWNPKMRGYIYGVRGGMHILDLTKTLPLLHRALGEIRDVVASNGRVLFVGTKRKASEPIAEAARACSQYCVSHRWMGGMLTNWNTIAESIRRLESLEAELADEESGLTKKERLNRTRSLTKLDRAIGGVRAMDGLPDLLFVLDTNKEQIAVEEAWRLGIPIAAILDSDSDPDKIAYPVPGNDDSARAVRLYCSLVKDAVLEGLNMSKALGDQPFEDQPDGDQSDEDQPDIAPAPAAPAAPAASDDKEVAESSDA